MLSDRELNIRLRDLKSMMFLAMVEMVEMASIDINYMSPSERRVLEKRKAVEFRDRVSWCASEICCLVDDDSSVDDLEEVFIIRDCEFDFRLKFNNIMKIEISFDDMLDEAEELFDPLYDAANKIIKRIRIEGRRL
jgi:hypothetical protein